MPTGALPESTPVLTRHTRDSGVFVIAIIGELDTFGTASIEEAFQAALPDRTVDVVIDLSGVPFLTSRALAMFVVKAQAMKNAGGQLHLAGLRKLVRQVFEQAGFASLFPIYNTMNDALEVIEAEQPKTDVDL